MRKANRERAHQRKTKSRLMGSEKTNRLRERLTADYEYHDSALLEKGRGRRLLNS